MMNKITTNCKYNVKEFKAVIKQLVDLDRKKIIYPITTDKAVIVTTTKDSPITLAEYLRNIQNYSQDGVIELYEKLQGESAEGKAYRAVDGILLENRVGLVEEALELLKGRVEALEELPEDNPSDEDLENLQSQITELQTTIKNLEYKYEIILFRVTDSSVAPAAPLVDSTGNYTNGWDITYSSQNLTNKYVWIASSMVTVKGTTKTYDSWKVTLLLNYNNTGGNVELILEINDSIDKAVSSKAIKDALALKANASDLALKANVSDLAGKVDISSLKTINNESIIKTSPTDPDNISISPGGPTTIDNTLDTESTNAILNLAVAKEFNKTVKYSQLKTINTQPIYVLNGEPGDIYIPGGSGGSSVLVCGPNDTPTADICFFSESPLQGVGLYNTLLQQGYVDIVKTNNEEDIENYWKDKKWLALGDSITDGTTAVANKYCTITAADIGMSSENFTNAGVNGSSMSDSNNYNYPVKANTIPTPIRSFVHEIAPLGETIADDSIRDQIRGPYSVTDWKLYDLISLMLGTNDCALITVAHSITAGDTNNTVHIPTAEYTDRNRLTFYNSYEESLLCILREKREDAVLLLCIPPTNRHDFVHSVSGTVEGNLHDVFKLKLYSRIVQLYEKYKNEGYNIELVNFYGEIEDGVVKSTVLEESEADFLDAIHPNSNGHRKLAEVLKAKLRDIATANVNSNSKNTNTEIIRHFYHPKNLYHIYDDGSFDILEDSRDKGHWITNDNGFARYNYCNEYGEILSQITELPYYGRILAGPRILYAKTSDTAYGSLRVGGPFYKDVTEVTILYDLSKMLVYLVLGVTKQYSASPTSPGNYKECDYIYSPVKQEVNSGQTFKFGYLDDEDNNIRAFYNDIPLIYERKWDRENPDELKTPINVTVNFTSSESTKTVKVMFGSAQIIYKDGIIYNESGNFLTVYGPMDLNTVQSPMTTLFNLAGKNFNFNSEYYETELALHPLNLEGKSLKLMLRFSSNHFVGSRGYQQSTILAENVKIDLTKFNIFYAKIHNVPLYSVLGDTRIYLNARLKGWKQYLDPGKAEVNSYYSSKEKLKNAIIPLPLYGEGAYTCVMLDYNHTGHNSNFFVEEDPAKDDIITLDLLALYISNNSLALYVSEFGVIQHKEPFEDDNQ